MLVFEHMVQVTQMADAQVRHFKNEDRVGIRLHRCIAKSEGADIGGHVADIDVLDDNIMVSGRCNFAPAAQDMGYTRVR